jgi:CDGSH-type Zn-finger protein
MCGLFDVYTAAQKNLMMDAACSIGRSTHVPNCMGSHPWRLTVLFTGVKTSDFGYEIAQTELHRL